MIIVPKFGEFNLELSKELINAIDTKIEIQMITKDLEKSFYNCSKVIKNILSYKKLDEVVFHMPFSLHTFELYVASPLHNYKIKQFLNTVEEFSNKNNLNIGILMHQENSIELLDTIPNSYLIINSILNHCKSNRIYFLVENCLPCMNDSDLRKVPAFELLKRVNNKRLYSCIDICHIRCYENIFETSFSMPESISNRVKWIHMAWTRDKDGYKDKSTHGVVHDSLDSIVDDLNFLIELNIDLNVVPLVAEISEKDYNACPDMLNEINMLKSVVGIKSSYKSKIS